ncbi:MAG: O-antigen ligase family protein [Candidatus Limnocylindrales bacterium]
MRIDPARSPISRLAGRRREMRVPALLLLVLLAVAIGVGSAVDPLVTAGLMAAVVAVLGLLLVGVRVTEVFLGGLTIMLIGYAFLGRGFAYVGVAPLYLGELALPVAALALLRGRQPGRLQPLHVLLLAFMVWGALRTIPYLGTYGLDALRDAVSWGYAAYAVVLSVVLRREHLEAGVARYRRLLPLFLIWVPILAVLSQTVTLPTVPGSDVAIAVFKGGDIGVQLAGAAAFVFLGLYGISAGRRLVEPMLWALWLTALAVTGILNRGGLVAASTSALAAIYIRAASRWLALVFVALSLTVPVIIIDPRIQVGNGREISVGQMVDNVISVFGESNDPGLEGTKGFRLAWWSTIVDYTIGGPYRWTGKGYGINLADDDGFQPTEDRSLRAPHNGHVEILARSGLPGLALWVLLNAAFGLSLLRAAGINRRRGDTFLVQVLGLVFIYWLASLVNASFDPYLQGPQGGIWFWTMFGVGLAAIKITADDTERGAGQRAGV